MLIFLSFFAVRFNLFLARCFFFVFAPVCFHFERLTSRNNQSIVASLCSQRILVWHEVPSELHFDFEMTTHTISNKSAIPFGWCTGTFSSVYPGDFPIEQSYQCDLFMLSFSWMSGILCLVHTTIQAYGVKTPIHDINSNKTVNVALFFIHSALAVCFAIQNFLSRKPWNEKSWRLTRFERLAFFCCLRIRSNWFEKRMWFSFIVC